MSNATMTQTALADALNAAIFGPASSDVTVHVVAAYIEMVFFLLLIQNSEEIFNIAYNQYVTADDRDDVNNNNRQNLDNGGFKTLLTNIRNTISNRRVMSSQVINAPELLGDTNPSTTCAGHTAVVKGVDATGKLVTINFYAVGTAARNSDGSAALAFQKMIITTNPFV
ncbi:hypothetical protein GQ53DRAFT_740461 [Thozetella sp. PMI_491]|nr:hypothetical protein GQ53DRAFT_740461 [Thozetella sp. PMI_491]